MSNYLSISYFERTIIDLSLQANQSISTIAQELKRASSTISREIERNSVNNRCYDARYAQDCSDTRLHKQRKKTKTQNLELKFFVAKCLKQNIAPDVMVGRAQLENFPLFISVPSIYSMIYQDAAEGGDLFKLLAFQRKKRVKHKKKLFQTNYQLKKTRITERPDSINKRLYIGDWEGDTLIGSNHKSSCLTVVERKSRFLHIARLDACTSANTMKHIQDLAFRYPHALNSITVDNGSEFSYSSIPFKKSQIPVYFTFPASPHQKGSIENANRLIRRYLPKNTDFNTVSPSRIKLITDILNHTPRKIGYRTPFEVFCSTSVAILI